MFNSVVVFSSWKITIKKVRLSESSQSGSLHLIKCVGLSFCYLGWIPPAPIRLHGPYVHKLLKCLLSISSHLSRHPTSTAWMCTRTINLQVQTSVVTNEIVKEDR